MYIYITSPLVSDPTFASHFAFFLQVVSNLKAMLDKMEPSHMELSELCLHMFACNGYMLDIVCDK